MFLQEFLDKFVINSVYKYAHGRYFYENVACLMPYKLNYATHHTINCSAIENEYTFTNSSSKYEKKNCHYCYFYFFIDNHNSVSSSKFPRWSFELFQSAERKISSFRTLTMTRVLEGSCCLFDLFKLLTKWKIIFCLKIGKMLFQSYALQTSGWWRRNSFYLKNKL